ncbi:hypothetical protein [Streptomyces sp. NPDC002054]|uniref:hypothetical protein n=1 Tax=Streptomyces sp. NPDC002054 TaxID=3154663 RepID=UPI003322AFC0
MHRSDFMPGLLAVGFGKQEVERVQSVSGLNLRSDVAGASRVAENGQPIVRKPAACIHLNADIIVE